MNFFCVVGLGADSAGCAGWGERIGPLGGLGAGGGGPDISVSGGREEADPGGVELVGGVFEVFERFAEAFERLADVRGGGGGEFPGIAEDGLFESAAEGEMEEQGAKADDQEGVLGQAAGGETLLERGDDTGCGLAFFLAHPGRGLHEVFEVHG